MNTIRLTNSLEIKEPDIEHIHRVLNGDTSAFRFLVEKYQGMVHTIAYKIMGNMEDAEDVAQEVFIKSFKSLKSYNFQSRFSTWLYRIAYNQSIDTIKKRKNRKHNLDLEKAYENSAAHVASSESVIDQKLLQSILKKLIDQLPEEERMIVLLYYFDEQPLKEIAEVIGIKENNVKIKLHRVRSKLEKQLNAKMDIVSTLIS